VAAAQALDEEFHLQTGGYMSTNWQDIPRDPLMDDDELQHLYHRARMQSSASAEPSKKVNGPESDLNRLNGPKKLPVSFYNKWRRGKVA
jgi:hypothetical protein